MNSPMLSLLVSFPGLFRPKLYMLSFLFIKLPPCGELVFPGGSYVPIIVLALPWAGFLEFELRFGNRVPLLLPRLRPGAGAM